MMLPVRSERLLPVSSNSTVSFCCFPDVIFFLGFWLVLMWNACRCAEIGGRRKETARSFGRRCQHGECRCEESSRHEFTADACSQHFAAPGIRHEPLRRQVKWRDGIPTVVRAGAVRDLPWVQHVFSVRSICHHALPGRSNASGAARSTSPSSSSHGRRGGR